MNYSKILKIVTNIAFAFLPQNIKIYILKKRGNRIGRRVFIGLSYLDTDSIEMGDNSRIGHFNIFKNLKKIVLGDSASIGKFNLFTSNESYKEKYPNKAGLLMVGAKSVITMRHYFDVQSSICIGRHSLIAGIQTVFFTHQKGINELDEAKAITVGDRVYVGARCNILPGTTVNNNIIIGAGSTISGEIRESFSLYVSHRAVSVKRLSKDIEFFVFENSTGKNIITHLKSEE